MEVSNKLEYRLYYSADGKVVTYTTEKMEGNYITVTAQEFAEARHDIAVINGKIVNTNKNPIIYRLIKNVVEGVETSKYDVNIITSGSGIFWKLEQNEST